MQQPGWDWAATCAASSGGRGVGTAGTAGTDAIIGLAAAAVLTPLKSHLEVLKPALHHRGREAMQDGLHAGAAIVGQGGGCVGGWVLLPAAG